MKLWKISGMLVTGFVLASCGGGGDVAGDVPEMTVLPSEHTWFVSDCRFRTNPDSAVTVHTINGGQPPFRIQNPYPYAFEFGTYDVVNGVRRYVKLPLSSTGEALLAGKDPQFVVKSAIACEDALSFIVLDYHSNAFVVEINGEGEEVEEE